MKCADCSYCWKDLEDIFPCCHHEGAEGTAPCEEQQEWDEVFYDDFSAFDEEGFDPYTGCWTGDC